MKRFLFPTVCFSVALLFFAFREQMVASIFEDQAYIDKLRDEYSSGNPKRWEAPVLDSSLVASFQDIGSLPPMEFPVDNPYSDAKKELGKKLFFDPRLSRSKQIACASCHDSQLGWGDGRTVSFGHNRQAGTRNSMTLLNIGYHKVFFWDGRASSLEEQALMPIKDPVEMHSSEAISVKNIRKVKGYKQLFKEAFGDDQITIDRIQKAIATYERTIVSRRTKFDQFIAGEKKIFSDQEVVGLHLFRTKARCINCHNTPLFSNQQFHNVGLSYYGRVFEDLGRYNITQQKEDVGRFKTPSLREITYTAPYMHNGLMLHLEGIVQMYNAGMPRPKPTEKQKNDPLFPTTDELLKPLSLTKEEQKALIAFLHTLSSSPTRERAPELPK
ncbi:Di-heme cytochrome C peroxidase [Capnocytophaga canis]|uniref:cytochrome-c peroxidase n=1 Tax=Capnocytophaga canis TaxID=1848903 RepID=UPI0005897528|nr:cytochrome c peroxidase [Capnocytophaga canis]CEN42730.1 Di-heme cytochrome C peroxidase [Capnocytophaga canis]